MFSSFMTRCMRREVIDVYKMPGNLGTLNYSVTVEDKDAFAKVKEQQMKGNIFFPHNMQLIYKTHKIAGCSEGQCKIQKALVSYTENESTGTFH